MNESPRQESDADASSPLGGGRLAIARLENEMSVHEIAKELHLDEPTVVALEQNNFEMLGAAVFAKGHLRKYAEIVGVPVDEILSDYYQLHRSVGAPAVVGRVRKPRHSISRGPWIATALVLIIAAIAAYWWLTREPAAPPTGSAAAIVLAPEASEAPVQEPAEQLPAEVIAVASSALPDDAPEPQTAAASLATAVLVELSFTGDCWAEVTDASGRRLFYELGTAGRAVALTGEDPLQLVLGNVANVSIAVGGRAYPIPGPARNGRLARLTINNH